MDGPGRKTRSKYFHELSDAEAYKAKKDGEALARKVLDPNYRAPWELDGPLQGYEEAYRLETYMIEMVRGNRSLRETTTTLYLRTIRTHIADTPLGQADIRYISASDLSAWWAGLTAGPGALRNVSMDWQSFRRRAAKGWPYFKRWMNDGSVGVGRVYTRRYRSEARAMGARMMASLPSDRPGAGPVKSVP